MKCSMLFNCLFFSIVRPNVRLLGPGRHMQEGDSVNLTCKVIKGVPGPKISWLKDGDPLSREKNTTLILTNVTDRDEGRYTCKAQNAGGSFSDSIYITVKSKLIKILITDAFDKQLKVKLALIILIYVLMTRPSFSNSKKSDSGIMKSRCT